MFFSVSVSKSVLIYFIVFLCFSAIITSASSENIANVSGNDEKTVYDSEIGDRVIITTLSKTVNKGETVSIIGRLNDETDIFSGKKVLIYALSPESETWEWLGYTEQDDEGFFIYKHRPETKGTWSYAAEFDLQQSNIIKIEIENNPVAILKTSLSLSAWPDNPSVSDQVYFSGKLTDSRGYGVGKKEICYNVAKSFRCAVCCMCRVHESDLEWYRFGSVTTDSKGYYSFTLPVVETGTVIMNTEFEGDEDYLPSKSKSLMFSISA